MTNLLRLRNSPLLLRGFEDFIRALDPKATPLEEPFGLQRREWEKIAALPEPISEFYAACLRWPMMRDVLGAVDFSGILFAPPILGATIKMELEPPRPTDTDGLVLIEDQYRIWWHPEKPDGLMVDRRRFRLPNFGFIPLDLAMPRFVDFAFDRLLQLPSRETLSGPRMEKFLNEAHTIWESSHLWDEATSEPICEYLWHPDGLMGYRRVDLGTPIVTFGPR
ncbi:MAG: hypothetical protein AAF585_06070 [Verrucomicrobiota bacterium]